MKPQRASLSLATQQLATHPLSWLGLLAVLVLAWFVAMQRFGQGNVYAVVGPYAALVGLVLSWLRARDITRWLRPQKLAIVTGFCVGATMTLLTYPAFRLIATLVPSFATQVGALYADAHPGAPAQALAWISVVIGAEELLFRGVLPAALERYVTTRAALAISLAVYALAQLGTGSAIVGLLAAICGAIWTAQRYYTDSLLSPLIAHLIWTPTVILLWPVTLVAH